MHEWFPIVNMEDSMGRHLNYDVSQEFNNNNIIIIIKNSNNNILIATGHFTYPTDK